MEPPAQPISGRAEPACRLAVPPRLNALSGSLPLLRLLTRKPGCCSWRFCGWKTGRSPRSLWAGKRSTTSCPKARPQLLRELTLAALTDLPDDLARNTLRRWIDADPGDVDAPVALLRRIGAEPSSR